MPTPAYVINVLELFEKTFGKKPYVVPGASVTSADSSEIGYNVKVTKQEQEFTAKGSLLKERFRGVDVLLPIRFYDGPKLVKYLPYCVIGLGGSKIIVKTPMTERVGSVREQYNIDDYTFSIKGFLINEDRTFPEDELTEIKELFELMKAVTIENALTNIFLTNPKLKPDEQRRVVITKMDLLEVQGGRHVRPFTMQVEGDTVFTLELAD